MGDASQEWTEFAEIPGLSLKPYACPIQTYVARSVSSASEARRASDADVGLGPGDAELKLRATYCRSYSVWAEYTGYSSARMPYLRISAWKLGRRMPVSLAAPLTFQSLRRSASSTKVRSILPIAMSCT
jgi:hypothetical protein